MDIVKFSIFDIFAYTIPGFIFLLSLIISLTPSITDTFQIVELFHSVDIVYGFIIVVLSYVLGFAWDSVGSWLYYRIRPIGYWLNQNVSVSLWGNPESRIESDLSTGEKASLVRQFSPENFMFIQMWKVLKTMSHNLSASSLTLSIAALIKSFNNTSDTQSQWLFISVFSLLGSVIFINRAYIFDTWYYKDLSAIVNVLKLKDKILDK